MTVFLPLGQQIRRKRGCRRG